MEKLNKIIVLVILPILLISSQSAFAHTVTNQECEDLGLFLDEMSDACVADLNIVCVTSLHEDLIGGGFRNVGTDQFGNSCTELHPSTGDFPTPDPLVNLLIEIFEMIFPFLLLFVVVIVIVIVLVIVIRRRRK